MPLSSDQPDVAADHGEDVIPSRSAATLAFLLESEDDAFRPAEIVAETDVAQDRIDDVLATLESRGLVGRRDGRWTVSDERCVAGLAASLHATRSVNDELGSEDAAEWMEHAAGEKE